MASSNPRRHLKETPEDVAVRDRLWSAERRQICRFAGRYNDEHVVGEAYSDGQKGVCHSAKQAGYKIGWVRDCASDIRSGREDLPSLKDVRSKMGV